MLQDFKRTPEPLQTQILFRAGISAALIVLLFVALVITRDIYLWLPCTGAALFYAISAFQLFYTVMTSDYVTVSGDCILTALTAVKRRQKFFVLRTDSGTLKVISGKDRVKPAIGAAVTLYISNNSRIYEHSGEKMLYTYLAIDVK